MKTKPFLCHKQDHQAKTTILSYEREIICIIFVSDSNVRMPNTVYNLKDKEKLLTF